MVIEHNTRPPKSSIGVTHRIRLISRITVQTTNQSSQKPRRVETIDFWQENQSPMLQGLSNHSVQSNHVDETVLLSTQNT